MTIEERKQRILEISRSIVRHEMAIESLKAEADECLALLDGRKRRALKTKGSKNQETEEAGISQEVFLALPDSAISSEGTLTQGQIDRLSADETI